LTSEELIVLLDSLQTRLPKCANQVLLRLVAKCIVNGTNEVTDSAAQIARELGMSEDSVKVARRALAGIVSGTYQNGIATPWVLPAEWFVVQRSLFAVSSPVENWPNRPGNQDGSPWKPGREAPQKPGRTALETRVPALETRAQWTSFQGGTSLETRAVVQENQPDTENTGLETRPLSIDRDRGLSSFEGVLHLRDSIEGVNRLPDELRPHAEKLKRWLRDYFLDIRAGDTVPDGPDEIILAKCLAIAELPRLGHLLKKIHGKRTKCGDTWAWWVTVFCQRVKGTKDTTAVPAHPAFHQPKKPASHESGGQFPADLLQQVSAAARTM
jgi:hypothetical protein